MKRLLLSVALAAGCAIAPPVSPLMTVPPDTAQKCMNVCATMGLTMSAVVVVANNSGCVCEPAPGAGPRAGGASAAAAGALIAIEDQREQQAAARHSPPAVYHPH
jgi:hypothetical protein